MAQVPASSSEEIMPYPEIDVESVPSEGISHDSHILVPARKTIKRSQFRMKKKTPSFKAAPRYSRPPPRPPLPGPLPGSPPVIPFMAYYSYLEDEELVKNLIKEKEQREGRNDYGQYEKLRRAVVDDHWHVVEEFIDEHPEALTAKLSDCCETILHCMVNSKNVIGLVRKYVNKMEPKDLELTDISDRTALSCSAIAGNKIAAEIMVQKNSNLPYIEDCQHNLPIHYAAKFGHESMVRFLLTVTVEDHGPFTFVSVVKLVTFLLTAKLYG